MKFILNTDAIDGRGFLDPRYTCDADHSSPELRWEGEPESTESFALIMDDPDAPQGVFTHWLVYQIPRTLHHLPAGIPPQELLPNGVRQGVNDFERLGYGSPCPPRGASPHRYVFRLYALNLLPHSPEIQRLSRCTREELWSIIQTHVLSEAKVVALYRESLRKTA